MPNINNPRSFDPSDKRVSFVYDSDISGFQPLDFAKLDNLEDVLLSFSGDGVNVHQDDLNPLVDAVSVSGQLYSIISGFDTFGVNVHQDDLNPLADAVSVSGELYSIISGFNSFGVNVHQDDLSASTDFVTAVPEKGSNISNYSLGSSNGTVLNANSNRKELYVQNLATGTLFVKYGSSASNTSFNFLLAGNSYVNAGDGGSLSDLGYTGIVSLSGSGPNYMSWERV